MVQPKMSPSREALVEKAFQKLDRSGDGQVTFEDIKGVYSVHNHPEYLNGQKSERELLKRFLGTFEEGGVVDGVVSGLAAMSALLYPCVTSSGCVFVSFIRQNVRCSFLSRNQPA